MQSVEVTQAIQAEIERLESQDSAQESQLASIQAIEALKRELAELELKRQEAARERELDQATIDSWRHDIGLIEQEIREITSISSFTPAEIDVPERLKIVRELEGELKRRPPPAEKGNLERRLRHQRASIEAIKAGNTSRLAELEQADFKAEVAKKTRDLLSQQSSLEQRIKMAEENSRSRMNELDREQTLLKRRVSLEIAILASPRDKSGDKSRGELLQIKKMDDLGERASALETEIRTQGGKKRQQLMAELTAIKKELSRPVPAFTPIGNQEEAYKTIKTSVLEERASLVKRLGEARRALDAAFVTRQAQGTRSLTKWVVPEPVRISCPAWTPDLLCDLDRVEEIIRGGLGTFKTVREIESLPDVTRMCQMLLHTLYFPAKLDTGKLRLDSESYDALTLRSLLIQAGQYTSDMHNYRTLVEICRRVYGAHLSSHSPEIRVRLERIMGLLA